MKVKTEIQYCSGFADLPAVERFQDWADCVLLIHGTTEYHREEARVRTDSEDDIQLEKSNEYRQIVVRLVDGQEMKALNGKWRDKPYATNVLAFPAGEMPGVADYPLGDIVICAEVVQSEAEEQGKPYIDRMAHIFIHGLLHLLGYDHHLPEHASDMERVEEEALSRLGYAKPYELP